MRRIRIALGAAMVVLTATMAVVTPVRAGDVKTSKERLFDKASDNQRVDNCKVPVERRGSTARPECQNDGVAAKPHGGQNTGLH